MDPRFADYGIDTQAVRYCASRAEALARGDKHFFTGKPCPRGHVDIRFTSNSGCRSCLGVYTRRYYWEHRDDLLRNQKVYQKKPEVRRKNAEQSLKWAKENPDKVRAIQVDQRARRRGGVGKVSAGEWQKIMDRYGHRCLACGVHESERMITRDHVLPLSMGGKHEAKNLQPLCRSCNSRKNRKLIDYRPEADRHG